MTRQAIFPGSFDPFTVGHESIVRRALAMFDEITIAIGYNSNKQTMFSLENRKKLVADIFSDEPRIKIANYSGLTVDFAKSIGVGFILRGLRTSADFEFERAIAQINKQMTGIDTVFLLTMPEHTPINSTIVRDIIRHGGDVSIFMSKGITLSKYL